MMGRAGLPPDRFATLIRSDFWFCDGNIVIVAGQAAFRVHRGQLERHSEVFSDLLSAPQSEDQELIDGCAVIELQDCPSEVFYFLSALYDGLHFKKARASDFPAVAAILRLSTKYLVDHLRQRCLSRLDADWSLSLAEWDLREQRCIDENGRYDPLDHCAHPILAIELALEMNLPSILPAALYDLSRYSPSNIMAGCSYPTATYHRIVSQLTGEPIPLEWSVSLSRNLLCRTLRGREATQRYMAGFIARKLHSRAPAPDCLNATENENPSRQCHETFYIILLNILRSVGGIARGRDADPLYTLAQATEMLSRTDFSDGLRQCGLKLCKACKADFAASAASAREEVWAMLPQWFGLVDGEKANSVVVDLD